MDSFITCKAGYERGRKREGGNTTSEQMGSRKDGNFSSIPSSISLLRLLVWWMMRVEETELSEDKDFGADREGLYGD